MLFEDQWFALQVRSRSEQFVSAALRYKGYEEFAPKLPRHSPRVEEALFPGYVFCRLNPEVHGLIVTTPGVIRIVSFAGKPAPIESEEIWSIQAGLAAGAYADRYPGLHPGDRIRIESGPLQGVTGTIDFIRGKKRLIIGVTTLMRSIVFEVDPEWVSDITPIARFGALRDLEPGCRSGEGRKAVMKSAGKCVLTGAA